MNKQILLWEILVPKNKCGGDSIPVLHHQSWDGKIRSITGGLTILKPVNGQWVSPDKELFNEPMIPVRIACTKKEMEQIADITSEHYQQQAVMFYLVSEQVVVLYYDNNGDRV